LLDQTYEISPIIHNLLVPACVGCVSHGPEAKMKSAIALLALALPCHAQLVDMGQLTYDPASKLTWLDVSLTDNISLADAHALWPGFRDATFDEVSLLFDHAGLPARGGYAEQPIFGNVASLLGATLYQDGRPELIGTVATHHVFALDFAWVNGLPVYQVSRGQGWSFNANYPAEGIGHWMVSVPEPGVVAIVVVALLLAMRTARRQR
jgi:hypothetical protein